MISKNIFNVIILLIGFVTISACKKNGNKVDNENVIPPGNNIKSISYVESQEDFVNPERGFYRYSETRTSNFTPLNQQQIAGYRNLQSIPTATYQVLSSLVFRYYILDNFKNSPITTATLNNITADMQVARLAGIKLIPRFVYTTTQTAGNCPESGACPPYGDAPKSVVLGHIAQLKPILTANADVIACVQLGLFGIYGENYYTDYFGDASPNGGQQNKLTDQNWQDRIDVLKAMLDAVPADRMVQVRLPQFMQRAVYGVKALTNAQALTGDEAFKETDKARLGLHNDCFLSGINDVGTFEDYGNSTYSRNSDPSTVTALRNYTIAQTKYVVTGGETCSDGFSPQNDCETSGFAQKEFADMHYSYLNAQYNTTVNNDWQSGGCMDAIKRNLGYRLVLKEATLPDALSKDNKLEVSINLKNVGYASPYNPRPVQLILKNTTTNKIFILPFATDIRFWFTGDIGLKGSFTLPADITNGTYDLFLNMPDKYETLAGNPNYSIRLANQNTWDPATGYNKLNHQLKIN